MSELSLTLLILVTTVVLFVSDRLRLDLVALMMLLALLVLGIVTPVEALAGFGDPLVIMIAALFVVGGAIQQTGIAQALGQHMARLTGDRELPTLMLLMVTVGLLSSFMSTTGTAAIFLPIAVSLARRARLHPGRLLIPMAFAALLGGMLTLIATPPNLFVAGLLRDAGLKSFTFFDFTGPGLAAFAVFFGYMLLPGRWLLRHKVLDSPTATPLSHADHAQSLLQRYALSRHLAWMQLPDNAPLYGQSLHALALPQHYRLQMLCTREALAWPDKRLHFCGPQSELKPGQQVLVLGEPEEQKRFAWASGATWLTDGLHLPALNQQLGLAEVVLLPRSALEGKTLQEFHFRERYRLHVLAIQRQDRLLLDLADERLRLGDLLLVQGSWRRLARLALESRDFLVLDLPPEAAQPPATPVKMGLTLAWLAVMLLLLLTGWLPSMTAILLTAVGLILTRCLSMEDAYRAISWESVVLIAAMLPLSTALTKTGGTAALGNWLAASLGGLGPHAILAALFLLTSVCGLFISNTATAVLIAPVALQLAQTLGYSPQTFLMGVALAASASLATPISSPANTMVLAPGGYSFLDYVKLGLPLQLLLLVVTVLVVPLFFGF